VDEDEIPQPSAAPFKKGAQNGEQEEHDDIMDFLVAIEADKQENVGNQYRLFPYQMKWI
jgi:hypothetical protein